MEVTGEQSENLAVQNIDITFEVNTPKYSDTIALEETVDPNGMYVGGTIS